MKKILIFCLMSLIVGSAGFAEFKFKPHLFLTAPFDFFYHKRDGIGFNMVGVDLTLFEYKSWRFLGFGVGVGAFNEKKIKWIEYGYYAWTIEDGKLKRIFHVLWEGWLECDDPYISSYFKLCLIKIPLKFFKNMKGNMFFDLGLFSQDLKEIHGIAIGFCFSFNVFKKN